MQRFRIRSPPAERVIVTYFGYRPRIHRHSCSYSATSSLRPMLTSFRNGKRTTYAYDGLSVPGNRLPRARSRSRSKSLTGLILDHRACSDAVHCGTLHEIRVPRERGGSVKRRSPSGPSKSLALTHVRGPRAHSVSFDDVRRGKPPRHRFRPGLVRVRFGFQLNK